MTLHDLVTRARRARRRDQLHVVVRNVLRADLFVLDDSCRWRPLTPRSCSKWSTSAPSLQSDYRHQQQELPIGYGTVDEAGLVDPS